MAKVGAQRAAVLTGKSKSTIQRAMKSGKLSYSLDQNKRRVIDVAELERVFGVKQESLKIGGDKKAEANAPDTEMLVEKERMAMQIKMLEQQLDTAKDQIDDLKGQRDKWEQQASQVLLTTQHTHKQIEDLRTEIQSAKEKVTTTRRVQAASTSANKGSSDKMKKLQQPQNENAAENTAPSKFLFWKKA